MPKPATSKKQAATHKRGNTLTQQIFIGLGLGITLGAVMSLGGERVQAVVKPEYFKPFSDLFLRLIKMIIAPIIFTSLVAGVAGAGHVKKVGRMGFRALLFFEVLSFFALGFGLLAVNLVRPGVGLSMPTGDGSDLSSTLGSVPAQSHAFGDTMLRAVPTSVVQAMAEGDVLQIVVFSIMFALALGTLRDKAKPVINLCEIGANAMFKLTKMIMHYAPIGVGAAMAYTIGKGGLNVLASLAWLVGTLYVTLILFIAAVFVPTVAFCNISVKNFLRVIKEPAVIGFSSTSSEAALPLAMQNLQLFGVPRRITSFILPLGYSFNLVGTTLYLSLAAVFIAQVANVPLSFGQQFTMLVTLMITSKGVAAVPRASMIILAGTLTTYGLPLEGLSLIMGVDALMDMARSTMNVVGNCLATVVIAKWEGEFKEATDEELAQLDAIDDDDDEDD